MSLESYSDIHTVVYRTRSVGMTLYSSADKQTASMVLNHLKAMRPSDIKHILLDGKYTPQTRTKTPGAAYANVPGGFDISKKLADLFEDFAPTVYTGEHRAQLVSYANSLLHDREDVSLADGLPFAGLMDNDDFHRRGEAIGADVDAFERQRELIPTEYGEPPVGALAYKMPIEDVNGKRLKIIEQTLYDKAVMGGFSEGFFRNAYFHGVTFFALPEGADFSNSVLLNCKFNVCAARDARFGGASIYSTDFQTVDLSGAHFQHATLAHTHFNDVDMQGAGFHAARLNNCNITHCNMWDVSLLETVLNEVRFAKIEEPNIAHMETASFHFGAVRPETAIRLLGDTFAELGMATPERTQTPEKATPEPER